MLLVLSMSMAIFSSCNNGGKPSSENGNSSSSSISSRSGDEEILTEITLPITEETVSFTEWRSWSSDWLSNYGETCGIGEVERLTNVHVDYICVPATAAQEKYGLMLAFGEYPDMIFYGSSTTYPGGLDAGVADGVLRDMTESVRKWMPNYRTLLENDEEIKRISITDEGKNVGIFMIRAYVDGHKQKVVVENEPAWCGMAIRQEWLDELNMEVPETIDELHEVLVAFRDNYGAWMHLFTDGTIGNDYILSAYGVTQDFYMIDGGDQVGFGPTTEEYKTYVTLMRDWYREGLIDPDFMSTNSTAILTDSSYYANDKRGVGMSYQGTVGKYLVINGYTQNEDAFLTAIKGSVLNKGDTTVTTYPSNVACSPTLVTTSVGNDRIEVLSKFLDWHYTYDYLVIQSFGVEGESYVVDENSEWYYVWTDAIKNPSTPGMTNTAEAYATWGEQTQDIMVPLEASFTSDESTEYTTLFVDIESYVAENAVKFIIGTLDIDRDWDTYLSDLEKMNVARCVELKQASVDRYYGKKWLLEEN